MFNNSVVKPFIIADNNASGEGDFVLPVSFSTGDSVRWGFCPIPDINRSPVYVY